MGLPGLRSLRGREEGLTQEKLARELDVTMGTVWRWENAKADAPDATKRWLCERFNCSFDELLLEPPAMDVAF